MNIAAISFSATGRLFTRRGVICLMAILSAGVSLSTVQASSPQLNIILPRGVQRGAEQVLNFHGARLADVEEVLFYRPDGFEVTQLEVVNAQHVRATVRISPDCQLGEQVVQLRARSGISEFSTFIVEANPAVAEAEPNGSLEEAQALEMNRVVAGVVTSEDVDYYVVEAKQGDRISAEIYAVRLGNVLFDPYIAILDSRRFELSANDDTALVRQDSVASIVAPEDGQYYIQVRETSYGGNNNFRYRLHVGHFPRPTAVYPAGGKVGESVEVTYFGDARGPFTSQVVVPTEPMTDFVTFPQDDSGVAPSPIPFRIYPHGNVLEVEPNNALAEGTPAELPNAFNGRISQPGDIDCFRFTATKGQVFEVECYARRIRSGLDPVINLYHGDGRRIAGNDDSRGPDSYLRFEVPDDGEYVIRVNDHLQRGSEEFVYRIEFQPITPSLSLGIPRVARYSQYRQSIFVPRGNRFATLISASRSNFGGELVLDDSQLPEGISMHAMPMRANMNLMPVVFEAGADAELSGKLVRWVGKHADPAQNISGIYRNSADYVRGPPNNAVYYPLAVDQIAFAVVDSLPFHLEIVQPNSPIVRNGSKNLKVVVHRQEGFNEAINLQFPFRPPGIGAGSSINIPAGQNEINYTINANGNAQLGEWPIYVIGSSNVNGAAWVASQLASLEVADPYVTFEVLRSSCEKGQPAQMLCNLNQIHPFEGEATATLLGLPANVTAEPLTFTTETSELIFNIGTTADSPVGKHRNVFVQVSVPSHGEQVIARAGGNELQIDEPIVVATPAEPAQPAEQPAQATPMPAQPTERPLSRLERLRLEAKKQREQQQQSSGG